MRARHAGGLLAVIVLWLLAATAMAQPYPPSEGAGQVSRSVFKLCQCTQFSGGGFEPGSGVVITANGNFVANVTANAGGRFTLKVCFDEHESEGPYDLLASGTDADGAREVRAAVTVSGNACFQSDDEIHEPTGRGPGNGGNGGVRPGRLPRTGAYVVPALLSGFALVLLGAMAVFLTRRRRALAS